MSILLALSTEVLSANQAVTVPMAGDDGILNWLTAKNTQTQGVLRGIAVTLGIVFVIVQAVASRGAMARVLVSLLAAGIFVWGVFSVTDIKDRVEEEVGKNPATAWAEPGPGPLAVSLSLRWPA